MSVRRRAADRGFNPPPRVPAKIPAGGHAERQDVARKAVRQLTAAGTRTSSTVSLKGRNTMKDRWGIRVCLMPAAMKRALTRRSSVNLDRRGSVLCNHERPRGAPLDPIITVLTVYLTTPSDGGDTRTLI